MIKMIMKVNPIILLTRYSLQDTSYTIILQYSVHAYAMLKRLLGDFPLIEAYEKVTQIIFHFDMM